MNNEILNDLLKNSSVLSYIKHFKVEKSFNEYKIEIVSTDKDFINPNLHCINLINGMFYSVLSKKLNIKEKKIYILTNIFLFINGKKYIHNLDYLKIEERMFYFVENEKMIYFLPKSFSKYLFRNILYNNSLPIQRVVTNGNFSIKGKFIVNSDKKLLFKDIEFFEDFFIMNNIKYELFSHNNITAIVKTKDNFFTLKIVSYDYNGNMVLTLFNNDTKRLDYRFSLKEYR